jgi:hypothetical protein
LIQRRTHYNQSRTEGRRKRCDGKVVRWLADWKREEESNSCQECGHDLDPIVRTWDAKELPYHLGPIRDLPNFMERCDQCDEEWQSVTGIIRDCFPVAAFPALVMKESPFRKALAR